MKIKKEKPQQFLNSVLSNNSNSFKKEFCISMLPANIPFIKLKNELFCTFLEKKKYQMSLF